MLNSIINFGGYYTRPIETSGDHQITDVAFKQSALGSKITDDKWEQSKYTELTGIVGGIVKREPTDCCSVENVKNDASRSCSSSCFHCHNQYETIKKLSDDEHDVSDNTRNNTGTTKQKSYFIAKIGR